MLPFQKFEYLLFGLSIIALLAGAVIILKYDFPKVLKADDIYTLLPPREWTPEKFERYKKHANVSRFGVSLVLTGIFWHMAVAGIHMLKQNLLRGRDGKPRVKMIAGLP